jgi:predicted dehydrogenase
LGWHPEFAHRGAGCHRHAQSRASAGLAENFPGARIHDGYEALLADPDVEAVYIATPHISHAEWAIKAAETGKHVMVEKPMG